MKFCYVDESGYGSEPVFVITGIITDSTRMHLIKDVWSELLSLMRRVTQQERWTYHYNQNEQIDYILISNRLRNNFRQAGVWRRGIANVNVYSNGQIQPYSQVTSWRNAASDHGTVWADFDL